MMDTALSHRKAFTLVVIAILGLLISMLVVPRGVPSTKHGAVWAYGFIGYSWGTTHHSFNNHDHTSQVFGAFRSEHPGGANFARCDGSIAFLADGVEHRIYDSLATRAGGEVVDSF